MLSEGVDRLMALPYDNRRARLGRFGDFGYLTRRPAYLDRLGCFGVTDADGQRGTVLRRVTLAQVTDPA